jgi:hypothetical protein
MRIAAGSRELCSLCALVLTLAHTLINAHHAARALPHACAPCATMRDYARLACTQPVAEQESNKVARMADMMEGGASHNLVKVFGANYAAGMRAGEWEWRWVGGRAGTCRAKALLPVAKRGSQRHACVPQDCCFCVSPMRFKHAEECSVCWDGRAAVCGRDLNHKSKP